MPPVMVFPLAMASPNPTASPLDKPSFAALKRHGDYLFLALTVALSASSYVTEIGFYSDDWSEMSRFRFPEDQSIMGIFSFAYDDWVRMRPGQVLYQILLYKAFDLNPLGHHITNTLVVLVSTLLCYTALQKLTGSRLFGLSIALLYSLLPHYSTDRLWYAAFQSTLSVALYFLSLCADFRGVEAVSAIRIWLWKLLSVACLLVSALCYELTIPLFFLSPFWVYFYRRAGRLSRSAPQCGGANVALWAAGHWVALAAVIGFKFHTTQRLGSYGLTDQLEWFVNFMIEAAVVAFGYLGVLLPWTALTVIVDYPDRVTFWAAATMGMLVFGYFLHVATEAPATGWRDGLKIALAGGALFGTGYAIFLTQRNVSVGVITGIGNRVAIVAALGVATLLVGAIGWLSARLPRERWRGRVFAGLMAVFCVSALIVNNVIADFWIEAYEREKEVLAAVQSEFPELTPGAGLILDGVCPYLGPGIVFESDWDLAGALRILYRNPKIDAHVVVPNLRVTQEGLVSTIYGYEYKFLYGDKLQIFDLNSGRRQPLTNSRAACEYFANNNGKPGGGCPPGQPGYGVPILRYRELPPSVEGPSVLVKSLEETCSSFQTSQRP